jgi:hypothetical protein
MKLFIDEYTQTNHTLFIDSDCICFGNLRPLFDVCRHVDVTVAGNVTSLNNWCSDSCTESIQRNFNLSEIIRFNGGLYYIKRGSAASHIFNLAREIAKKHLYGYDQKKNKWVTEELAISVALMLNNQHPICDNGQFMTDLSTDYRPSKMNVLQGSRLLVNPAPPSKQYRSWYPPRYSPLILHYGGQTINSYPYNSQKTLLKLRKIGIGVSIATLFVNIFIHLPYKSYYWVKALQNTD